MKLHEILKEEQEFTTDPKVIDAWFKNGILSSNGHIINSNGHVDVNGDVNIQNLNIKRLPFKFGDVSGKFTLHSLPIESLDGAPIGIHGSLHIWNCNELTSLKGDTHLVNHVIIQDCKKLSSLEGFPKECSGNIAITDNKKITSVKGLPGTIYGELFLGDTKISSFKEFPKIFLRSLTLSDNQKLKSLSGIEAIEEIKGKLAIVKSSPGHFDGGLGLLLIKNLKTIEIDNDNYGALAIIKKHLGDPDNIYDCQAELVAAGYEEYAKL